MTDTTEATLTTETPTTSNVATRSATNRVHAFLEGKVLAEARRQNAIHDALVAFEKTVAEIDREQHARYEAASAVWDIVKSHSDHPFHAETRAVFEAAKRPADHTEARAELDRAIRAADAAYYAELVKLGQVHGVHTGAEAYQSLRNSAPIARRSAELNGPVADVTTTGG